MKFFSLYAVTLQTNQKGHIYIYIYIYIYVCVCMCVCLLFSPVKPELGVIPSGQKKPFNSEHLNFPGKELNVTDITEQ